jgi:hypothetical protein
MKGQYRANQNLRIERSDRRVEISAIESCVPARSTLIILFSSFKVASEHWRKKP